ncbi:MAG: ubiquinone/menaquinone biosynthesis methyltransferase [Denitrobacterium sp.]|jgi:demethylmenaquinone methyltransferase/2-methoxy-6-polyprenyl-1,4-benzoquinol methylase|nr:ubiquinone/menaquinone biosynthesis methyltransferase [Denitrobacterium sp.]
MSHTHTTADAAPAAGEAAAEDRVIDTATGQEAPAELSEQRVLGIFTEIADQYEQFNHASSFGQDRHWLDRVVEIAPVTERSRVLDVAGGTGEVTFALCRAYHPEHIILSDYTPGMLEVAKQRIARGDARGVDVETKVVDGQNMPFADASFDVVTMAYGIRNMPDRMACLREIYRVLEPGGTAIILEFSTPPRPAERAFYNAYLRWGIPAWGEHFTGKRDDFVYLAQSIKAFPGPDQFCDMLRRAGFSDPAFERKSFGAVAIYTASK